MKKFDTPRNLKGEYEKFVLQCGDPIDPIAGEKVENVFVCPAIGNTDVREAKSGKAEHVIEGEESEDL